MITRNLLVSILLAGLVDQAAAQAPAWTVNASPHEFTMNVTAALVADDVQLGAAGDRVCAYVTGEGVDVCRGTASATLVGSGADARHLFFLTVYGTQAGETLRFRAWDASDSVVRQAADSLGFAPNAVVGDPVSPQALHVSVHRSLAAGWNLIGYDLPVAQPVALGLDALIQSGKLIYAVGFDETGATFFDPAGLPFLNTLLTLEPRYGYWVKLTAPHDSLAFPTPAGKTETAAADGPPSVQFLQGRALRLQDGRYADVPAGEAIEVLAADDAVLAVAEVLADGLLMTTPVYGRDSAPPGVRGAAPGERLRFRAGEVVFDPGIVFQGSLEPIRTNLLFEEPASELPDETEEAVLALDAVWPNPASDRVSLRYRLDAGAAAALTVYDVLGRSRSVPVHESMVDAGTHEVSLDVRGWAPGVYVVVVSAGGARRARSLTVLR